ncbi:Methionyl-tRNA formyltransferase, partial [Mycoplasmopsis edwardii]
MTKAMDAGDIIFKAKIDILDKDTSDSIFAKLSVLAKEKISAW